MIEKMINEYVEKNMEYRIAQENEYRQIAEMKWLHCEEDDADYSTNILLGADRSKFIEEFVDFLNEHREYKLFVAVDNGIVVSSMFVYMIPKTPKPNRNQKYIAYLTNVYSLKEYRNKTIGTELLKHIKDHLSKEDCELMFVWPSKKSVNWYIRNGFESNNEIFECSI